MSDKAIEILRRARLKLSSQKYRFFGLCIYPLRIILKEEPEEIEGYVKYEPSENDVKKFENKIYVNSKIVDMDSYNTLNMIDILMHENNHILRRHDIRLGNRDPILWNIACDHIIDKSLKRLNLSKSFRGWNIIPQIENDKKYDSEESVYNWLVQKREKEQYSITQQNGQAELKNSFGQKVVNVDLDLSSSKNINQPELQPEQKQEIENYISQVRAIYNIEKERGNIAGNISSEFEKLIEIVIPWDVVLEKALKTNAFQKTDRRNWKKLNKFYQGININLPGKNRFEENNGVGTLIIHIDSSGSISKKDLQKAGYIIYKSIGNFEKTILLIADVSIHQQKEFNKFNQNELLSYFKNEGIKGRGGTSHLYVFNFIEDFFDKNKDELSMIISITDLYSDVESIFDKYQFTKSIPMIFLCNSPMGFTKNKTSTINIS